MNGSIRRRGKYSWEITIPLKSDIGGKRKRKFVNVKGKKSDAERKLRELMTTLDKGLPIDTSKLTVGELLDRWFLDYARVNTKPRTQEGYEVIIRLHLKPPIGSIELPKLQAMHVQGMESDVLASGKSARTVKNIHTVIHVALEYAMRMGLIWSNPAHIVKTPKAAAKEAKVPSLDDVQRILESSLETPYHAALHFLAFTGARRGEALGLRWADLDLESSIASIVQTLHRVAGRGLIFDTPKTTKGRRAIALDKHTVSILKAHRGQQAENRLQMGDQWQDFDLVFPGTAGKPLDPSVLTHRFKKIAKKLDVNGVRLHDLRHFHATELLKKGVHPKVVQERLGHATISITLDTYSHVIPSLQAEAANLFADAMNAMVVEA